MIDDLSIDAVIGSSMHWLNERINVTLVR